MIPKPFRKVAVLPHGDGRLAIWFADAETKTHVMSSLPTECFIEKIDLGLKVVITTNPCFGDEGIARAILHLAGANVSEDSDKTEKTQASAWWAEEKQRQSKGNTNPNQMDWVEETEC